MKPFKESELLITNNLNEAMYLLPDGLGIWGEFYDGVRCADHRQIEQVTVHSRYDEGFWDEVHFTLGLVRLVPETETALIRLNQELTDKQQKAIERLGYDIEVY